MRMDQRPKSQAGGFPSPFFVTRSGFEENVPSMLRLLIIIQRRIGRLLKKEKKERKIERLQQLACKQNQGSICFRRLHGLIWIQKVVRVQFLLGGEWWRDGARSLPRIGRGTCRIESRKRFRIQIAVPMTVLGLSPRGDGAGAVRCQGPGESLKPLTMLQIPGLTLNNRGFHQCC